MSGKYLLLCGGVGGSRLAAGFADVLPPERLTIVVNTGDDFDHFGLRICPDIDTVTYMLAGLVDEERGWGRRDETWRAMEVMGRLGGETWFNLGDQDLALHLRRTELLRRGRTLSDVTTELTRALGVAHPIVPMTNDEVRTVVRTADGDLAFQDYFVRRRAEPVAREIAYCGAADAKSAPDVLRALADPSLRGVAIAPSNPVLSVAPILAIPEIGEAIRRRSIPVVAVSPFIGGKTIKGPAAKLMHELGYRPGAEGLTDYYRGLVDGLVVDIRDGAADEPLFATDTLMTTREVRAGLAKFCLALFDRLQGGRRYDR